MKFVLQLASRRYENKARCFGKSFEKNVGPQKYKVSIIEIDFLLGFVLIFVFSSDKFGIITFK